jgi:hypothetical protein
MSTMIDRSVRSPRPARLAIVPVLLAALGLLAAGAGAVVSQQGNLRVAVSGKIAPRALPRTGVAPIAVSVAGDISTTDESLPPQLRRLRIEINREGRLDTRGLPVCPYRRIQPATDARALAACRSALVGRGTFDAYIVLKGEPPYPAKGRLLVFNGREGAKPVLFGHIYLSRPFASSFVITFEVSGKPHGRFGTTLTANLAKALGTRRYLTGISLTLSRRYSYRGTRHSYLSAGCPAPKGFGKALFPLARTSFDFAGGKKLVSTLAGSCRVR